MSQVVATFYKFVSLPDCAELQPQILAWCTQRAIRGTILLAAEGINGTIAGTRSGIDTVLGQLRSDPRLADLEHRESISETIPFDRMKVRLKTEIVTLGMPEVNPAEQVGAYVDPQDWNALMADPEVLVLDTRNDYEVKIGSFAGAINPKTQSFREFPAYVQQHLDPARHHKIAMFCTGGIRCEKASAYLLQQGFAEVYHLKGGILSYLDTVPTEESAWEGECFLFDQRVAVQHGLESGSYDTCLACGHPINDEDKQSPHYDAGISCPYCYDSLTPEKRARQEARRQ